ncbi:MAG: hypothetical protein AAF202_05440 [Pseudomonadota bacterium]
MKQRFLLLSLVCMGLLACGAPSKKRQFSNEKTWAASMQGLADEVRDLVPYLYSQSRFSNPRNREVVAERLKRFAEATHSISSEEGRKILGADPIVEFSLAQLGSDANRASEAFSLGRIEYSRATAKAVMNHCFRCHSMAKGGGSAKWTVSSFEGLDLKPVEKADLMVATRKFKEAAQVLNASLLKFEMASRDPFAYEALMKKTLALAVRQPETLSSAEVITTFESLQKSKLVPKYLKNHIGSWIASLQNWDQTGERKKRISFAEVQALIRKGREKQSYFKDHSGDVEFLRASTGLHKLLLNSKSTTQRAKTFLLLGETYEVLDELGYWGLHEIYYESCIRATPRTQTSRTCYNRLRNSLYLGYSGSAGTNLPASERQRLKGLETLTQ